MDSEPVNARDAVWHHNGTVVLDILAVERHAFLSTSVDIWPLVV